MSHAQGSLSVLVRSKFSAARAAGDVVFSDTQLAVLQISPAPSIQLRYCPALNKKPTKQAEKPSQEFAKPFDPFANPDSKLLITSIPVNDPSHNLVLNKYPVIENHFILATKENLPQTGLLDKEDLFLIHACIQRWHDSSSPETEPLFAFFNSGDHSGASQPHRHIQFLPVDDMHAGDSEWQILCNTARKPAHATLPLLRNPDLPFVHYACPLAPNSTAEDIHARYMLLLRAALCGMNGDESLTNIDTQVVSKDNTTTFSYNLAMTSASMSILPRKAESSGLPDLATSSIAINGTILAGTMMVKTQDEWELLRQNPSLVLKLLDDIAFPASTHEHLSQQRL